MVDTPTLDRILELQPQSQAVGEFLEWIKSEGYVLCKYNEQGPRHEYLPIHKTIDTLLHDFFEIDPMEEEREKRALLDEIRSMNG